MTFNHLLLYRLAELMLKHEQHVLSVDLLFDDEQIGDFVKSIQIDSPYQQMLLEGVLTESVSEEKLYVGYTIEGYFHYVLGEVIYKQAENKHAYFLREIIDTKRLKGTFEGVEQCLIKDIDHDNLSRLMNLIDMGERCTEVSVKALLQSFIRVKSPIKQMKENVDKEQRKIIERNSFLNSAKIQTDDILKVLFSDYSSRDVNVLEKVIEELDKSSSDKTQMVKSIIFNAILSLANSERPEIYKLALKGYTSLDLKTLENLLLEIGNSKHILIEIEKEFTVLSDLGFCYRYLGKYEKAIEILNKSIDVVPIELIAEKVKILGRIGSTYGDQAIKTRRKDLGLQSVEYCRKALELEQKHYPEDTIQKATQMNNLAKSMLTFFMLRWSNDFSEKEIESLFCDSLEMIERLNGPYSPLMGGCLNNLSMLYADTGKTEKSLEVSLKAYGVVEKVFSHYDYRKALLAHNIAKRYEQLKQLEVAVNYYKISVDIDKHLGLLLKNKSILISLMGCLRSINNETEFLIYKELYNSLRN